jgi:hypothetical protein
MKPHLFKVGYLPDLPGLRDEDVVWRRLESSNQSISIQAPELTPAQIKALATRVKQASREHLKPMRASEIVQVIDTAVARLLNQQDPYRQQLEAVLPAVTGFDAEMVRLNLNAYLQTFRSLQLHRFITEDFANPKVLDEFQPRAAGGWCKAVGPDLLVHVWAGNVPALSLWSLVSGLLVKSGSIGKVASAEPIFATVFARLLVEVESRWRDCLAVVWWQGGDQAQERCAFAAADVVMAYGGNAALQTMQSHTPITTRFLAHGHKLSLGVVSAKALSVQKSKAVARQAALDVVRYDQQGCYSPHVFYVQRGAATSPQEFAHKLAGELSALQHKLPRRDMSLEDAASAANWRSQQELLEMQSSKPHAHQVLGDASQPWSVVYSDVALPLSPSPLNRNVLVIAVDALQEVALLIEPQRMYLQTVGLAASPEELLPLSEQLGAVGVTRICALGAMTSPQAGWHHDGRFSLLDLVRMVDIEQSTELAAEQFTTYEC